MKTISITLLAIFALSCSSRDCDNIVSDYQAAKQIHANKVAESQIIMEKLQSIPMDSVSDYALVEDELMISLIEIATIEIQLEEWKKQYARCLTEY